MKMKAAISFLLLAVVAIAYLSQAGATNVQVDDEKLMQSAEVEDERMERALGIKVSLKIYGQ